MSFLFPLYLLGAAAIAVPILLHLRRRPPKERVEFGSLMFLEKTPERLVRRSRLEQILLLALRCLALILLALAFGRPYLQSSLLPEAEEPGQRVLLLVDRSASMQREGLRAAAIDAAREAAAQYDEEVELSLALFDESLHLLAEAPTWSGLSPRARAAEVARLLELPESAPGWRGTDLGQALHQAANHLLSGEESRAIVQREIVLVSDFQSGARRERLQANPWPEEVQVRCLPLAPEETGNLSIALASTPLRARIEDPEVYRVRLSNSATSSSAKATLSWKGHPDSAINILLAPGQSRIFLSAPRPEGAERGTVVIEGDQHPFDNEIHVAPTQARPLRMRFLGQAEDADRAGTPLFYLQRALHPTPALQPIVSIRAPEDRPDLQDCDVVVAADQWSVPLGQALHQFAASGGLVIALPSGDTSSEAYAALTGQETWKLSQANVRDFAMLADLDFTHPVLEPFARAQIRDFTKIRYWKHLQLDFADSTPSDEIRILATFDGKAPALIDQRVGSGAVFSFLGGWRPEESQFALSSKFVPFLYSLFEQAGHSLRAAPTLTVGETHYGAPGFYEEPQADGTTRLVAVNLDPAEGLTDAFDVAAEFSALGIPLLSETSLISTEPAPAPQWRIESEQKEAKQKLWKWLVLGALLFLLAETWLAGRRSQRAPADPVLRAPA